MLTVPIFNARMAELKSELKQEFTAVKAELKLDISALENRLFNRMVVLGLTAVGLVISSVFFIVLNLKK